MITDVSFSFQRIRYAARFPKRSLSSLHLVVSVYKQVIIFFVLDGKIIIIARFWYQLAMLIWEFSHINREDSCNGILRQLHKTRHILLPLVFALLVPILLLVSIHGHLLMHLFMLMILLFPLTVLGYYWLCFSGWGITICYKICSNYVARVTS